jgi:tRNA(Ile)-lysidine synthase
VEDPTNREARFLRNRIRHDVLPSLASAAAGDVVEALARIAAHARGAVEAIERIAASELRRLRRPAPDGVALPLRDLAALPREVAAEVLRHAAAELGAGGPMRAWAHRALARALASPPPRRTLRAGGVRLEVGSGMVRVSRSGGRDRIAPRTIPVPGRIELPEAGLALEARLAPAGGYQVPRQRHVAAFDAAALPGPLVVRSRRRGDRFRPFGGPGERRLKSFLIDARIPRWERDRVPVVEAGGEIVWVAGLRRGAQAPVISSTSSVLELALKPLANSWPGWLQCSPEIGP